MMYNKAELKAIQMIANKLNWNKPVIEVLETVNQMVRNQQCLELDTVGECDDFEETLLSIALWKKDQIISTMFISDYYSLIDWDVTCFCEDMGINKSDLGAMLEYYATIYPEVLSKEIDWDYSDISYNDYQYGIYMGWI